MARLILNDRRAGMDGRGIQLEMDGEKKSLSGREEMKVEYGEHTLRIYENFLVKSREIRLDVRKEETEIDVTFNYKIFIAASVLHLLLAATLLTQLRYSGVYLAAAVVSLLIVDFVLLTGIGIYKLEIRGEVRTRASIIKSLRSTLIPY